MVRRLAILCLVAACGGDATDDDDVWADAHDGVDARPAPDAPDGAPVFRDCRGASFTPPPVQEWRHDIVTPAIVASGSPVHSGQDVLVEPGGSASLPGKFTYGTISKDLEDEDIRVFLYDCQQWVELGDFTTDSDGRISAPVAEVPGVGVYEARLHVLGDQSSTTSYLWVLPRGTHLVVTDIDGTMTESDSQLFQQMFDGSHVPVAYPGAVELTTAHRALGHVVFFLTGRPYWLTEKTRVWLRDLEFTPGPLRVTNSNSESLPTEGGVGTFKMLQVEALLDAGYLIDFAYGNASTDIYAYLGAGLLPTQVWIIGDNAGDQGTQPATGSWVPRVAEVQALPPVTQPFSW